MSAAVISFTRFFPKYGRIFNSTIYFFSHGMLPQTSLHICTIHFPEFLKLHIKVRILRNKEISQPFLCLSFGSKTSFCRFPALALPIRITILNQLFSCFLVFFRSHSKHLLRAVTIPAFFKITSGNFACNHQKSFFFQFLI